MKRKVVTEDIFAVSLVGDAQVAPDGRVAYVLTQVEEAKNGYSSAIWVTNPESEPTRLTFGQRADGGVVRESKPQWKPGGGLSFLSNRNGRPQVFLLVATEGEAKQLTAAPDGVTEYTWSPDGRYLAYTTKDPQEVEAAEAKNPDVRHITHLRYKFNGIGFTDTRRRHLHLLDTEDGAVRRLTEGEFDVADVAWSPDGARLAFSACIGSDCELQLRPDIWVVQADGGNLQRLTQGKGTAGSPVFSPDGSQIAFFGHAKGSIGYANTDLWVVPSTGGTAVNLTEEFDRSLGCSVGGDARMDGGSAKAAWAIDGQHLFVTITDGGYCHLHRVGLDKSITALTTGEISITSFSQGQVNGENVFAYVAGSLSNPGDVYLWQADQVRQLTHVNAVVMADWLVADAEQFTYESTPGWEIEGWIMKPADFEPGQKYPLVLHIHGGPHATYGYAYMHEFQLLAAAGYGVLFTNPRGSKGYGEEFTKGVVGDWGGGDYADLMAAVDYAVAEFAWVDGERVGVTGGSYGGYMTNWMVGQTDRFKAAVTLRSICNMYTKYASDIGWYGNKAGMGGRDLWDGEDFIMERSPIRYAPQVKTPILIIHSEEDYRCPMEQAEQWYVALKRLGVTTEFVRFAGENHELSRSGKPRNRKDRLNFIVDWFQRYL